MSLNPEYTSTLATLSVQVPPPGTPVELASYLTRLNIAVSNALRNVHKLPITNSLELSEMPLKPDTGGLYYFGQPIPPDITVAGYWGHMDGTWVLLGTKP